MVNVAEMPGAEKNVAVLSAAMVVIALIILDILQFIFKNILKAALLTSLLILLFCSYGHVYDAFIHTNLSAIFSKNRYLFPLWTVLIFGGSFLIIRIKKDLTNFTKILNFISAALIVMTVLNIYQSRRELSSVNTKVRKASQAEKTEAESATPANPHDIIYMIIDGYPNETTLNDTFHCDISDFTDYLRNKGFYIATKSTSNYMYTPESLSSSLNMTYLDGFIDPLRKRSDFDKSAISKLIAVIEDNKVKDVLKSQGYKTIHFSSIFQLTNRNRYFDVSNKCAGAFEFWFVFLKSTMLLPFSDYFEQFSSNKQTDCVTTDIPKIEQGKRPFFAFAHIDVIHYGWVPGSPRYCSDLNSVNDKLKIMLDKIFTAYKTPPIIVMQGDHGTLTKFQQFEKEGRKLEPALFNSHDVGVDEMFRERMRIFNAYYLPDGGESLLYDRITPVNTFRVIFDYYFNMNFELLDDRNYFPEGWGGTQRFDFVDVSDRVRY